MKIYSSLTKEGFWNKMMEEFPKSMKSFCNWIDEYKKLVDWNSLLREGVKYHDLPYAMQQGIWISFCHDQLHRHFEQPEYMPDFDFEEEVKNVFSELEPWIDDED